MGRTTRGDPALVAGDLVRALGGRYSTEVGIDLDRDGREVERWLLAATLFGTRISAAIAVRTYREMARAGVATLADVESRSWGDLVEILDRGGYVRYDFRTATRLQALAVVVRERHDGRIGTLRGRPIHEIRSALDDLPGWGPVTVSAFLREMRGVWPGLEPALGERALQAAGHLGFLTGGRGPLACVRALAARGDLDVRDLETALVRFWIAHHRDLAGCQGGRSCTAMHRLLAVRASSLVEVGSAG